MANQALTLNPEWPKGWARASKVYCSFFLCVCSTYFYSWFSFGVHNRIDLKDNSMRHNSLRPTKKKIYVCLGKAKTLQFTFSLQKNILHVCLILCVEEETFCKKENHEQSIFQSLWK